MALECCSFASSLVVHGPDDIVLPVITRYGSCRQWREVTLVVLHRNDGLWTHVYACVVSAGRTQAHLVRVFRGDLLHEAVDWVAARSQRPGPLFVGPSRGGFVSRRRPAGTASAVDAGAAPARPRPASGA